MPADNRLRFDDNQNVSPCRPETAQQNSKHPILDSEPWARVFSLEYSQLLAEDKDLQAEAVTGTEEGVDVEEADEKRNHRPAFMA